MEIAADAFVGLNAYQQKEAASSGNRNNSKDDEAKNASSQACLSFSQVVLFDSKSGDVSFCSTLLRTKSISESSWSPS